MPRVSAGLLMYRIQDGKLQVLLAHPGGPFFKNKDDGAWTIPKGEIESGEDMVEAAEREFKEETGVTPTGPLIALTPIKQKGGKIVHAWAFKGDCDPSAIVSNTFTMEWPPKSGRQMEFPEIDRADFFDVAAAMRKINTTPFTDAQRKRLHPKEVKPPKPFAPTVRAVKEIVPNKLIPKLKPKDAAPAVGNCTPVVEAPAKPVGTFGAI